MNLEATKTFMFSLFKDGYMSSYTSKYGNTKSNVAIFGDATPSNVNLKNRL